MCKNGIPGFGAEAWQDFFGDTRTAIMWTLDLRILSFCLGDLVERIGITPPSRLCFDDSVLHELEYYIDPIPDSSLHTSDHVEGRLLPAQRQLNKAWPPKAKEVEKDRQGPG